MRYVRQGQGTGSCAAAQLQLEEAKGQGHGFEEAKRGWFASPRGGEAEGDARLAVPGARLPGELVPRCSCQATQIIVRELIDRRWVFRNVTGRAARTPSPDGFQLWGVGKGL